MARELPDDYCLCQDGTPCHFHGWERRACLTCGYAVWMPTSGQLELVAACGRCTGVRR